VFRFNDHATRKVETPPNHVVVGDMVARWEGNVKRRIAIEEARGWVADTFHAEDGDTVRTLRLRKGWSQIQLAKGLGTSQSHVARIERGTENLAIETCRRLCGVLGIDMNTLDESLRRQEVIAQAKAKR
jgi:ribosome-binding protein aMBF1 (putative translation factor)